MYVLKNICHYTTVTDVKTQTVKTNTCILVTCGKHKTTAVYLMSRDSLKMGQYWHLNSLKLKYIFMKEKVGLTKKDLVGPKWATTKAKLIKIYW
jgi:heme/copper-type cytochrome/quinol oxidase subunit 3